MKIHTTRIPLKGRRHRIGEEGGEGESGREGEGESGGGGERERGRAGERESGRAGELGELGKFGALLNWSMIRSL